MKFKSHVTNIKSTVKVNGQRSKSKVNGHVSISQDFAENSRVDPKEQSINEEKAYISAPQGQIVNYSGRNNSL